MKNVSIIYMYEEAEAEAEEEEVVVVEAGREGISSSLVMGEEKEQRKSKSEHTKSISR